MVRAHMETVPPPGQRQQRKTEQRTRLKIERFLLTVLHPCHCGRFWVLFQTEVQELHILPREGADYLSRYFEIHTNRDTQRLAFFDYLPHRCPQNLAI
ncbi:hypothetical protein GCM10009578_093880 [Streptomyces rhizosphaericus]